MRDVVGPYRISRCLGEGGMGVVYEARDERLDRSVALKMLKATGTDESSKARMRREARAGASVSHPGVCQVYDVGEIDGEIYVAMELLEGEPLSARIARGPIPPTEALHAALGMLSALEALHARGILHRDLKPTNVFLTPHGVKLLDFGLAIPLIEGAVNAQDDDRRLTVAGTILGTPQYMAPERWTGDPIGPASDLFAVGALLFEMLTGRAAFSGRTPMEVFHAVAYEQPPALSGGGGALALDRLLQHALAKSPAERPATAAAMAQEIRSALADVGQSQQVPAVKTVTRLIVLPFRLLRADADIDFLSVGLADAISTSLAGLSSLVVRSARAGVRFQGAEPDLKALAGELGVDVVLLGTLMKAGDRVRVTAQLVDAAAGTIVWSETAQVSAGDVFQLQDDLAHRIVGALSIPLSAREQGAMQQDVPRTPRAYELYLRANQMASVTAQLAEARDTYLACLAEDPRYAPAWARLGRVHRVMAKFGLTDGATGLKAAEEAFRRALSLNPELSIAHNLFTHYEVEELGQARDAMTRLLKRAAARLSDPELFAGLVLTCRFGGLLEASVAADRRAKRLDPSIQTSVQFTHWMAGDYERAMAEDAGDVRWMRTYSLPLIGRTAEAIDECRAREVRHPTGQLHSIIASQRAALENRPADAAEGIERLHASSFHDPEGLYFAARTVARVGRPDLALPLFERVVAGGFHCHATFVRDPWLDSLRGDARFSALLRQAEDGRRASAAAFAEAGGGRLLGVTG